MLLCGHRNLTMTDMGYWMDKERSLPAMARGLRISVVLAAALVLPGCGPVLQFIDCHHLYPYLSHTERREDVLRWADQYVLGHPSSEFRRGIGKWGGPGRNSLRGLPSLPKDLWGNEIRLVAEGPDGISIIFIGRGSYQGLWISRDPMPGAVESVPGLSEQFTQSMYAGRVAVQCYQER
ncbi:hypothetical protein C1925_02520 [Stenotrophomonas sp. SAU14A_NAIMI4_5]|nr:hypothetical protein C1925_02520 [Stenotrophomonas sp. SAU14A_NAIMI4_5]